MEILQALQMLDPFDEAQWTSNGMPLVEKMQELTGDDELTRKQITDTDPNFNREVALDRVEAEKKELEANAEDEQGQGGPEASAPATPEQMKQDDTPQPSDPNPDPEVAPPSPPEPEYDDPDILELDLKTIFGSRGLTEEYIAKLSEMATMISREKDRIEVQLAAIYSRSDLAERMLIRIKRANKGEDSEAVQGYLKRQAEARERRAASAKAFIAAATTQEDVVEQLQTKSPLDRAMSTRGAKLGSTRPALGLPVRK